jgi:hypothetical protein
MNTKSNGKKFKYIKKVREKTEKKIENMGIKLIIF